MARYGTNKRSGRYNDWKKFSAGMAQALGNAGEHLSGWAKEWMNEAVQASLDAIDSRWPHHSEGRSYFGGSIKILNGAKFGGDHFHPWYTGQLHDSVAGFVTDKNNVIGSIHYMQQLATAPQTYKGPAGTFTNIIGREWAVREAQNATRFLLPGIQAKLVVGVPYARDVDETGRHSGYLDELVNQFATGVEDYFMIKADGFRTRIFVADNKKK